MLQDAINLRAINRVLVIKLRHHGDVLLSSPVFSLLKSHAPHLQIDALIYAETREMLDMHPAISAIHVIDRSLKQQHLLIRLRAEWALFFTLRQRRYDLVIHLTEHPRGAWLTRLLGVPLSVAPQDHARGKWWQRSFTHFYKLPRGTPRHTVELNLDALRRIGVYPKSEQDKRLSLVPGDAATARVRELLKQRGVYEKQYLLFHPTSRWLFKCWPEQLVAQLINALQESGHSVVLTTAPDTMELAMAERILQGLKKPIINLSGQLTFKEWAALCAMARCLISVDSAPMHIAAAMQTPVVAFFGPSSEMVWGPWQVPHRILSADYSCRPCGNDGCGGGKVSECLHAVTVEEAQRAIAELLA